MIVTDTLQATIAGAVRAVAGRMRDPEAEERMARYDAYEGRNLAGVQKRYFTPMQRASVPLRTQKVVQKIIDARFVCYKTPPVRTADERYLELLGDLDGDMLHLERMTGLQGTMAMLRFWDADKEVLDSRVLPVFEPLVLAGEVEPFGVIYPLHQPGETDRNKRIWAVWTVAEHFLVSGTGSVMPAFDADDAKVGTSAQYEHGIGLLPVLFSHTGPAIAQRWFRAGADDIVNAQLCFNTYGTLHSLGLLWQALGQAVATGVDDPNQRIQIGMDRVMTLPQGATFRFESPSGNLAAIIEAQRWVVDSVAYANHLQVKWASGGGATSGEHLRMLEVDLTEAVMGDFNRWREFESLRYELDSAILAAQGITVSGEYSVDFSEPHIPDSPAEKRERWDWELGKGFTTKARVLKEMNPDMSEEQIAELLAEIGEATPAPAAAPAVGLFAAELARPVNG